MHPDGMGWSWDQLQATPSYVRRYCTDFLNIKARVIEAARERERSKQGQPGGVQ